MVTTCRDLYGQEVFHDLRNTHRLLILISGGGGDFSIALNRANTQVYMAIYSESRESYQNEACIEDEELKSLNFNVKSNNYLVRSYIASEAKSKGGYLAVEADKEGYLLEGAVATIALLLKNGDFIVPPFDRRLAGTTAIKIMDYIQKEVLSSDLLPDGYLKQIVRREILISEAKDECVEIMFLGGEECVPILEWDGEPVQGLTPGKKGPAATLFQEYLQSFSKVKADLRCVL